AKNKQILAGLLLQFGDLLLRLPFHEPRVLPFGLLQRLRKDDFRDRVHEIGDLAFLGGPIPGHSFVRHPAEQQHPGRLRLLDRIFFELITPDAVVPIDVPALRAFEEAIQRDQIPHDEFSHVHSPIPARFDPSRGQSPAEQISVTVAFRRAPHRPESPGLSKCRSVHSTSPGSPTERGSGVARSTTIGARSFRKRSAIPNPSAASTAAAAKAYRYPLSPS